jgi:hypothetical protein
MSEPKAFASLSPSLLARKGSARPAMRPQLGPWTGDALARQLEDLGWNDMGQEEGQPAAAPAAAVVPLAPVAPAPVAAPLREVERPQEGTAGRPSGERRSALAEGRRAAFTLRIDAERHLKLRLACALSNTSAQQLVTKALDQLFAGSPDLAELVAQVARRNT